MRRAYHAALGSGAPQGVNAHEGFGSSSGSASFGHVTSRFRSSCRSRIAVVRFVQGRLRLFASLVEAPDVAIGARVVGLELLDWSE